MCQASYQMVHTATLQQTRCYVFFHKGAEAWENLLNDVTK